MRHLDWAVQFGIRLHRWDLRFFSSWPTIVSHMFWSLFVALVFDPGGKDSVDARQDGLATSS